LMLGPRSLSSAVPSSSSASSSPRSLSSVGEMDTFNPTILCMCVGWCADMFNPPLAHITGPLN
jgi:hypothetical protein